MARLVGELDDACAPMLDAAAAAGARVWVVSEYGHVDVTPADPAESRAARGGVAEGSTRARSAKCSTRSAAGPSPSATTRSPTSISTMRTIGCRARARVDLERARRCASLRGPREAEIGLDHPRAGELVALSRGDSWFAYPYWLDDRLAPDFARTVDIHRKPGYDPCELFFDPSRFWPQGRAILRLARKKLGFRTLFDVVPLDPSLVRGSHGLPAADLEDRPVLIGDGPAPRESATIAMTETRDLLWRALVP